MNRIDNEKATVAWMIGYYCRRKEGNRTICLECDDLLAYAIKRLDRCRYGERKNACQRCSTHCYAPAYREKIREVMRFSGPRMLFHHPVAALRHIFHK